MATTTHFLQSNTENASHHDRLTAILTDAAVFFLQMAGAALVLHRMLALSGISIDRIASGHVLRGLPGLWNQLIHQWNLRWNTGYPYLQGLNPTENDLTAAFLLLLVLLGVFLLVMLKQGRLFGFFIPASIILLAGILIGQLSFWGYLLLLFSHIILSVRSVSKAIDLRRMLWVLGLSGMLLLTYAAFDLCCMPPSDGLHRRNEDNGDRLVQSSLLRLRYAAAG